MKKSKYVFIAGWGSSYDASYTTNDKYTTSTWRLLMDGLELGSQTSELPWWALLEQQHPLSLQAVPTEKTFLIGWSLGGLLALSLAAGWSKPGPSPIAGLVLIASTACLTKKAGYAGVDPLMLRAMQQGLRQSPEQVLKQFSELCFNPDQNPAQCRQFIKGALMFPVTALEQGLAYLQATDLRAVLRDCNFPTLILHGKRDRVVPFAHALYLKQQLTNATSIELPQAGHALPYTHSRDLISCMKEFFYKND